MAKKKLHHLDTKEDRADYDRTFLSKKSHLKVIQATSIADALANSDRKVHFLVNIRGFEDILLQIKERKELAELIASISVHSCESGNLFLFSKKEGYLKEYEIIKNKIKSTCTEPARTAGANIFLTNL